MTAYSPSAIRSTAVLLIDYRCNHCAGERSMNGVSAKLMAGSAKANGPEAGCGGGGGKSGSHADGAGFS
jgi:hypothetical protein